MSCTTRPSSGHALRYTSRSFGDINSIGGRLVSLPTRMAMSLSVVNLSPRLRYEINIGEHAALNGFFELLLFVFILLMINICVSLSKKKITIVYFNKYTTVYNYTGQI